MAAETMMKRDHRSGSCHTPPGVQQNEIIDFAPQAPVENGGSFLLDDTSSRFPCDPETNLPYPLMVFNLTNPPTTISKYNYHHSEHPRKAIELEGNMPYKDPHKKLLDFSKFDWNQIAGIAVRVSRVNRTCEIIHTLAHKQCSRGPLLPQTMAERFNRVLWNIAGVIPHFAYDPTAPVQSRIRYMTPDVFGAQTGPRWVHPEYFTFGRPEGYQKYMIGHFFAYYAATQDVAHMGRLITEEFVSSPFPERRAELGRRILKAAVDVSISPLQKSFQEHKRNGLIQAGVRDRNESLFDTAWRFTEPAMMTGIDLLIRKFAS